MGGLVVWFANTVGRVDGSFCASTVHRCQKYDRCHDGEKATAADGGSTCPCGMSPWDTQVVKGRPLSHGTWNMDVKTNNEWIPSDWFHLLQPCHSNGGVRNRQFREESCSSIQLLRSYALQNTLGHLHRWLARHTSTADKAHLFHTLLPRRFRQFGRQAQLILVSVGRLPVHTRAGCL